MATLFKREGSPFWWIYSVVGNKKVRTSTGIRHESRRKPCEDAEAILRKVEADQAANQFGIAKVIDITIRDMVDAYVTYISTQSDATKYQAECIGGTFAAWCDNNEVVTVSQVTAAVAAQFIDSRRSEDKPSTLKTKCKVLARVFNEAARRNHIKFGPNSAGVPTNPFRIKVKVPKSKKTAFTTDEMNSLLSPHPKVPAWITTLINIAAFSGARLDSVANLRWEEIGFDMGFMNFSTSKTGSYSVPLHPTLREYLLPLRKTRGTVLPEEALNKSDSYLSKIVIVSMAKMGVKGSAHKLRHTYVTFLERADVSKRAAMRLVHHASESVHDIYAHREAMELSGELGRLSYASVQSSVSLLCPNEGESSRICTTSC